MPDQPGRRGPQASRIWVAGADPKQTGAGPAPVAPVAPAGDRLAGAAPAGDRLAGAAPAGDQVGLHPGALLALLADPDRLRCVAALVLGATSEPGVAAASGLSARAARRAVGRLVGGGLVARAEDGELRVVEDRFGQAARSAAGMRPAVRPEELGADPQHVAVLRGFLIDGRLASIPAHRGKRLVVLDFLAQRFEPGRVYPERDVNAILGRFHPDYAALRRYLVDEDFLERREGFYWRTGGTFDTG